MQLFNDHIRRINEKLTLLIRHYQALQKENERLKLELEQKETKETDLGNTVNRLKQQLEISAAYSGQAEPEIKRELEKRINTYIKEIDQYIAILSAH